MGQEFRNGKEYVERMKCELTIHWLICSVARRTQCAAWFALGRCSRRGQPRWRPCRCKHRRPDGTHWSPGARHCRRGPDSSPCDDSAAGGFRHGACKFDITHWNQLAEKVTQRCEPVSVRLIHLFWAHCSCINLKPVCSHSLMFYHCIDR